jgi:hypothetical protein
MGFLFPSLIPSVPLSNQECLQVVCLLHDMYGDYKENIDMMTRLLLGAGLSISLCDYQGAYVLSSAKHFGALRNKLDILLNTGQIPRNTAHD